MSSGSSRVKRTWVNAKVNILFYVLTLVISFFGRRIFLEYLGDSYVGLTGTLSNILGYLNLAELGVGTAVAFNLYKPIHQGDRDKIKRLISVYGYYYNIIGLAVLGGGIILSCFIPLIFKSTDVSLGAIFLAFYAFLINSLLGYFINYRQIMLTADQRNYVVTAYYQSSYLLKTIVQIIVTYQTGNYYLWILTDIVFGVLYSIFLNRKITRDYPWLKCSVAFGKENRAKFRHLLVSTRQVFIHKFKDFLLTQSDQLFVFAFISLQMVAYYGNYVMIITRITSFFSTTLDSVAAGVGNLIAEDDKEKISKVFWELMALRYFMAGVICFSIFQLVTPFVALWVGKEYVLSEVIVVLFVVNLFIMVSRGTVDNFNGAYGHYADVWAAWVEIIINVGVTIVGGYYWGIPGILLGKTVSMIPIVIFWKPLYLFREGFHQSYALYWRRTSVYYILLGVCSIVVHFLLKLLPVDPSESFGWWIVYATVASGAFSILYFIGIKYWGPGGKTLIKRLPLEKLGIRR